MDLTPDVKQRRMGVEDLPAVAALERMAGDARWSAAQWAAEFEKKISRYFVAMVQSPRSKVQGRGLKISEVKPWTLDLGPETVVGYAGGWIIAPELQLANIVIHPEFRCRGIGRRLLEALLAQAQDEGCDHCTLEVRRDNRHAQALYRAAGFRETGVRPKGYTQPDDDAVFMEKTW